MGMYSVAPAVERAMKEWWRAEVVPACRAEGLEPPAELATNCADDIGAQGEAGSLFLSQTCGLPLVSGQAGRLRVVAVPHYAAEGCDGPYYSSAIVVRRDAPDPGAAEPRAGAVMAVNDQFSMSGALLASAAVGRDVAAAAVELRTGAHAASARAVADGRADFAGIDAVTLALLRAHEPELAAQLRVARFSPRALGLPWVTRAGASDEEVAALGRALAAAAARAPACTLITGASTTFGFDDYRAGVMGLQRELSGVPSFSCASDDDDGVGEDGELTEADVEHARGLVPADEAQLRELLQWVRGEVAGRLADGAASHTSDPQWGKTHSGRVARLAVPGPLAAVAEALGGDTWCVGFFGERPRAFERAEDDCDCVAECWRADRALVAALDPGVVLAYCVAQSEPGGDWGNLVLLHPDTHGSADAFTSGNALHAGVVGGIAGRYYRRVRIHRARVSADAVSVFRTLVVEYGGGRVARRGVVRWPEIA